MRVVAEHDSNPPRHDAQLNSLRVGGLPPIQKHLLQSLPHPLVAPHPLLDQIVPGLVHQAAGLQVLRGKLEEAGDKEVFTSFSDGKQLADIVHLGEGVSSALQYNPKKKKATALENVYNGTILVCHERSKKSRHDILHADLDQSSLKVINWSDLKLYDLKILKLEKTKELLWRSKVNPFQAGSISAD